MQAHNQPARHFKQLCDFINIQYLPKPLHIDIKSLIVILFVITGVKKHVHSSHMAIFNVCLK